MSKRHVMRYLVGLALVSGLAGPPATVAAQTAPPKPTPEAPAPPVRLRVKLVVDRMEGEKPVSSVPFELLLKTGTSEATLNHGKDVAIPQQSKDGATTMTYRAVGSNIQVSRAAATDQLITFDVVVDISSVDSSQNAATPFFRKFTLSAPVVVRPGETAVVAVSTDQQTGETVRLTVTANIVR